MTAALLPTHTPEALASAIVRAVECLTAGEPVGLPTETVYGLAADASNPAAVVRIFEAKERPFFDPLIVHVSDRDWLGRVAFLPASDTTKGRLIDRLVTHFWPGPLTLLLPKRPEAVPDLVTAGSPFVAVRSSAHPVFRAVVERFGRPLAAPSANRFGRISPTTGAHVLAELADRISLVLDAGPTPHGVESTIVSFASLHEDDDRLIILRPGPITQEMLAEFGEVDERTQVRVARGETLENSAAPGQLPGHYAPRTPLVLANPDESNPGNNFFGKRIGLLRFARDRTHSEPDDLRTEREEFLSETGDLREAATRLFAALRRLDEAGLDIILAERVPNHGIGVAINERLHRAAAGSGR